MGEDVIATTLVCLLCQLTGLFQACQERESADGHGEDVTAVTGQYDIIL